MKVVTFPGSVTSARVSPAKLLLMTFINKCVCWLQVYKNFVEAVDAIDNGVSQFDCDTPARQVRWDKVPTRAPLHVPNY